MHRITFGGMRKRMGWRGRGGRSGSWPGRGPFNYLPPWQRPGWVYGYGRGAGYGYWRGRGYIGRGYGYPSPYDCQRFPWLPRWWWANPSYVTSPVYPPAPDPSAELKRLEAERDTLMRDIETMKKHVAEGTTPATWPSTPFGPAMFPTDSPEEEKLFLEQQQNAIRAQMEAIKKRLEELGKEE